MDRNAMVPMSFTVVSVIPGLSDRELYSKQISGHGRLMDFEPRTTRSFQIEYDLVPAELQMSNYYSNLLMIAHAQLPDGARTWTVTGYSVDSDMLQLHVSRFGWVSPVQVIDYVDQLDMAFQASAQHGLAGMTPLGC